MGWKPGQGVGPRLSRIQKSRQKKANERMFGCSLPPSKIHGSDGSSDENDEDTVDPKYQDFLFAPDDIPEFVIKPKDNFFGIAYKGLDRSTLLGSSHINLFEPSSSGLRLQQQTSKAGQLKIKGQAFGVGAYEEDDDDIYARDDMGQYDFALTSEENKNRSKNRKSRWGEVEKLSDTLEGFSLAGKRSNVRKAFPLPELPKNFVPKKGVKKSRFEPGQEDNLKTTNPTPNQRKMALLIPKERIDEPSSQTCSEEQLQKLLSANADQIERSRALGSFQPFARDPLKQKRYEQFLVCMKNNRRDGLAILQPKTMTDWEREREKVEFERAALLYRPMSGTMNSKFVSAGSSEDAAETKVCAPKDGEGGTGGDAKKAAQMKMFGRLTHEKVEWHPDRLLCIRFNVKNPFSNNSVVGVASGGRSKFELFNFTEPVSKEDQKDKDGEEPNEQKSTQGDERKEDPKLEEVPLDIEEPKPEKPPLDLFKSIFLDSSSESESEEPDEPKVEDDKDVKKTLFGTELESTEKTVKPWEEKKENTLRNPSAPKGIFANIDFDRLNQKNIRKDQEQPKSTIPTPKAPEIANKMAPRRTAADFFQEESSPEKVEVPFGPPRPEHLRPRFTLKRKESSEEDSEDWVEDSKSHPKKKKRKIKKEMKKQKKRKKEKKAKKSKKKSKKKSRKHDSSTSASDSSSSES